MKKFEQPVVALNEMMMSESIASICCYSKTTVGNVWGTSSTVINALNGGSISSGVGKSTHYMVRTEILQKLGGIIPAPQVHYYIYTALRLGLPNQNFGPDGATIGGVNVNSQRFTAITFTYDNYNTYFDGKTYDLLGDYVALDKDNKIVYGYGATNAYAIPINNQICDHSTSSCPWVKKDESGGTAAGTHTGSQTAHSMGGQKWWEDHIAQQYAS
ncbi:hypothetical protein FACS1894184_12930 [Clostridia bacterium]|nr:hypothetical protein FACS1894184_12930 [Clostridia bacterium]